MSDWQLVGHACDGEFTSFDIIGGDLITWGMVEILKKDDHYFLGNDLLVHSAPRSTKYYTNAAQEIHGISYWKASTFQSPRESCIEILNWLKPSIDLFPLDFIFHGTGNLDWRWIKMHFQKEQLEQSILKAYKQKPVSTLTMARKNLKQLPNHKLSTVASYYGIKLDHHDALSDARACGQIYCNIKNGVDLWTGELGL